MCGRWVTCEGMDAAKGMQSRVTCLTVGVLTRCSPGLMMPGKHGGCDEWFFSLLVVM